MFTLAVNAAIAVRQRQRVLALQASFPQRPILVQPLAADAARQKATPWVPVTEWHGGELWTRTILPNEIVFDFDSTDWARVREQASRVQDAMTVAGVPHYTFLTGGKGVHIHAFFDPASVTFEEDFVNEVRRFDVDAWRVIRERWANWILDGAGLPAGRARWAPLYGTGIIDRLKVVWSIKRKGSMVRVPGCAGNRGFRKTLVTELPRTLADSYPLTLPPAAAPVLYRFPQPLLFLCQEALQNALQSVQARVRAPVHPRGPVRIESVPCMNRVLSEPTPRGGRNVAFVSLVVRASRLGYSEAECDALVQRALAANGLPTDDPAVTIPRRVFERGIASTALACPNLDTAAYCDAHTHECPLRHNRVAFEYPR